MLGNFFGLDTDIKNKMDQTSDTRQAESFVFDMPYGLEPDKYTEIKEDYDVPFRRSYKQEYVPVLETPMSWNFMHRDDSVNQFKQLNAYINNGLNLRARAVLVNINWHELSNSRSLELYKAITTRIRNREVVSLLPLNDNTPDWAIEKVTNQVLTGFYVDVTEALNTNYYPFDEQLKGSVMAMIVDSQTVLDYYMTPESRQQSTFVVPTKRVFSQFFDKFFAPDDSNKFMFLGASSVGEYEVEVNKLEGAGVFDA